MKLVFEGKKNVCMLGVGVKKEESKSINEFTIFCRMLTIFSQEYCFIFSLTINSTFISFKALVKHHASNSFQFVF